MRSPLYLLLIATILSSVTIADPILGTNPAIPANMQITTFASGLNFPYGLYQLPDGSILAATSNGTLFGSSLQILRITQTGGVANPPSVVYNGGGGPATGLTGVGNLVAVATGANSGSQIVILQADVGGNLTQIGQITFIYPGGLWWHDSHAIAMRAIPGQPNSYQLLFSVGSQNNDAVSSSTVGITGLATATLNADSVYSLPFTVSGSTVTPGTPTQLATGLRNAFALGFNANGDIYIGDNGADLVGNTPKASDEFDIIPAGSGLLNFGYPNTYIDPVTGQVIGPTAGTQLPFMAFLPLGGLGTQGVGGLALSPSGFPAGLNNGVFFGFFGKHGGGTANDLDGVVYVDATTGQYFDFIPGAQNGLSHPMSLLSTGDSLYIADMSPIGSDTQAGTGVIYRVTAAAATITVGTNPAGNSFTVDGLTYTSTQTFNWTAGDTHTIACANSTAAGPQCTGWSDGLSISHTVTAPATPTTYTANFVANANAKVVDSSFTQISISGSIAAPGCAGGSRNFTVTVQLLNNSGATINSPTASLLTLTQGNTLVSQSWPSSIAPGAVAIGTFNITLANCNMFQLYFDVIGQ